MFKSDKQRKFVMNMFSQDRDKLLAKGKSAKGYMNCKLFTQNVSGCSDLESLPKVKYEDIEPSDILVYGTSKYPMHYAIYLGDNEVMEVPEWGKEMAINKIEQDIGKPFRAYRWKKDNFSSHPQSIGSIWVGDKYVHGLRLQNPSKFKSFKTIAAPKDISGIKGIKGITKIGQQLPRGSKLVIGKLHSGDEGWSVQSTLIPKKSKLGKSLIKDNRR